MGHPPFGISCWFSPWSLTLVMLVLSQWLGFLVVDTASCPSSDNQPVKPRCTLVMLDIVGRLGMFSIFVVSRTDHTTSNL